MQKRLFHFFEVLVSPDASEKFSHYLCNWIFTNLCLFKDRHYFAGGYPNNAGPYPGSPEGLSRGDCLVIANFTDSLCFAFRTDNSGPPESIEVHTAEFFFSN